MSVNIIQNESKIISVKSSQNISQLKDKFVTDSNHINLVPNNAAQATSLPIVFDLGKAPYCLEVEFNFDEEFMEGFRLEGLVKDSTLLFSGELRSPITKVECYTKPNGTCKLAANIIHWQLSPKSGDTIPLGSTLIEIFWVDVKNIDPSLRRKGIPVQALQHIATFAPLTEFPENSKVTTSKADFTAASPIEVLVNNVFNANPPRYNVSGGGASKFISGHSNKDRITLHYKLYSQAKLDQNSVLNCYDAACVLQYELRILGIAGIATKYCFMKKFGYLKKTNLIGRGECNNPFYRTRPSVVDQMDERRTSFGNHAFLKLVSSEKVLDACAGPHIGTESLKEYVNAAVDPICKYPEKNGTVEDIKHNYHGVFSTDMLVSINNLPEADISNNFHLIMNFSVDKNKDFKTLAVFAKWPSPTFTSILSNEWSIIHEEIVPGTEEVLKLWMLKKGDHTVFVKLFVVSTDNSLAYNRFLSIGTEIQSLDSPYERGPADLGHYSATTMNDDYNECFWVFHNIVFSIESTDTSIDVLSIASQYYDLAFNNITETLRDHLPAVELNFSNIQPKVGDRLTVSSTPNDDILLDFSQEEEVLKLVTEENNELVFDVLNSSQEGLKILVIDKNTLLVNTINLTINDE